MAGSLLNGKRILAVTDDPDILAILEDEILMAAPACYVDKATNYPSAIEFLVSLTYDLIILDIVFVRTVDLLNLAVNRSLPFPVVMLTAHQLLPEALKPSVQTGVRAYFPKENLREIIPCLEDALKHQHLFGWKRLFGNLRKFFNAHQRGKLTKPQRSILGGGPEDCGRGLP